MNLTQYMEEKNEVLVRYLGDLFSRLRIPPPLRKAMEYMVFSSGKRMRPVLVFATYESLKGDEGTDRLLPFASAIEMIHTYSLIHDDLPAIDNDDMRRGRPTCHKVFGEAIAILAGDALLTEAFRVITDKKLVKGLKPGVLNRIVFEIAKASGAEGMVGGQTFDIVLQGQRPSRRRLRLVHSLKTASLIRASVRTGAILAGARGFTMERLSKYATYVGLAFQMKDDLLDLVGREEIVGKRLRKDHGKQSLQYCFSLEEARRRLEGLVAEAERAIAPLELKTDLLFHIARFVAEREK